MIIKSPRNTYDIVIVGGGMVGGTFAVTLSETLKDKGLKILVVEANAPLTRKQSEVGFDSRSTALSFGSKKILNDSSIWLEVGKKAEPIRNIIVSDKGRFGTTKISSEEQNLEALGFVVENKDLVLTLSNRLSASRTIDYFTEAKISSVSPRANGMNFEISTDESSWTVSSALLVLAEGGRSSVCEKLGIARTHQDYKQHAIVSNVAFENGHAGNAFERFTDTGPLAVLPLRKFKTENRCSVVWSVNSHESDHILTLNQEALRKKLQDSFGHRLGRIVKVGKLDCFPLRLSVAREQIRPGMVLLGNVAHTLHPVAGQGMNLALRDMEALVKSIGKGIEEGSGCGDMCVLQRYIEKQAEDHYEIITLTDRLVSLFSSSAPTNVMARKFGLLSLELFPPLRKTFARKAMGLV